MWPFKKKTTQFPEWNFESLAHSHFEIHPGDWVLCDGGMLREVLHVGNISGISVARIPNNESCVAAFEFDEKSTVEISNESEIVVDSGVLVLCSRSEFADSDMATNFKSPFNREARSSDEYSFVVFNEVGKAIALALIPKHGDGAYKVVLKNRVLEINME